MRTYHISRLLRSQIHLYDHLEDWILDSLAFDAAFTCSSQLWQSCMQESHTNRHPRTLVCIPATPAGRGCVSGDTQENNQGMNQSLGNTIIAILQFSSIVSAVRLPLQPAQVQGGLGVPVKCRPWMELCTPFPKNIPPPSGLARSKLSIYLQPSLHQIHSLHWRAHTFDRSCRPRTPACA